MFAKFMQTAAAVAILATPALAAPDTITLAMVLEPPNLDPTGGAAAAIDEIVYANLFEGLTRTNEYGEPVPALADRWIISTDGLEYIVYLERRGIENGNRAGLRQLLRIFRALVNYAKDELHMYGANPAIFEAATEKMAWGQVESKAVNPNIIRRIEFMDRSLFSEQE